MNIKALTEKRDELQGKMDELVNSADTEQRAMSDEEIADFDAAEKEIRAIDETIARAEKTMAKAKKPAPTTAEERAAEDEKDFADYVLGRAGELRAGEQNLTMGNNGAIIPTTISDRIIKAVKDRCPILAGATIYNVKGTLKVPVWGNANSTHNIAVGYQTEFTEITADSGAFAS
ncbi:MAG: phage major capsid protein, partial [Oscillospiraceae bacterium]|nr:phage major capsid protein [Oscillospiraceae bacterium]